jgi:DNA processing protein
VAKTKLNHKSHMEHLIPWLTLKSVSGIGNLLFCRLVKHFGSPKNVLSASVSSLRQVPGISSAMAATIAGHHSPDGVFKEIERCREKGFQIITQQDSRYPALLLHTPDPPPVLYCYGTLSSDMCHIAVVGSRKATGYGKNCAGKLCSELAAKGVSVVSGMANGIDTAAHVGAIEGRGNTIAVLGSGLEHIYPPSNRRLFHRIAKNGAVISEFTLNTKPKPHHFPQRNRVISGMALGTVVVEATKKSGSLITAKLAAEQGREVFAVPGSILADTTRGTHDLIKQGAKLVENAHEIIEEVGPHIALNEIPSANVAESIHAATKTLPLNELEEQLLAAIGPYPVHIDDLARRCDRKMGNLTALLCQLELKGAINQEPGKFFVRSSTTRGNDEDF